MPRLAGGGERFTGMLARAKATVGAMVVAGALALSAGGVAHADTFWQCATFARMFSGIQLFGDAWTWWNQASGQIGVWFIDGATLSSVSFFTPGQVPDTNWKIPNIWN